MGINPKTVAGWLVKLLDGPSQHARDEIEGPSIKVSQPRPTEYFDYVCRVCGWHVSDAIGGVLHKPYRVEHLKVLDKVDAHGCGGWFVSGFTVCDEVAWTEDELTDVAV